MSKRKPYQKRPESDTNLKPHHLARAGWYDVTMVVELTRTVRVKALNEDCLLYTSPSPRDGLLSRMPSSA